MALEIRVEARIQLMSSRVWAILPTPQIERRLAPRSRSVQDFGHRQPPPPTGTSTRGVGFIASFATVSFSTSAEQQFDRNNCSYPTVCSSYKY